MEQDEGRAGHRARCAGKGRLGAPACAPRPSRPRRPSAGPRSRLRPPGSGLRPGRESWTRRGGRFLSGPGKEGPGAGRAPAVRGGSPLDPRGLGSRLCDGGGALRPAGRRPYPGQHHPAPGPLTSPSQQTQPPQAGSRLVTGARLPALRRGRACAVASVHREHRRRALPAFNRSRPEAPPLPLSPPPPATPRPLCGEAPPSPGSAPRPAGVTAAVPTPAPTEISRFVLLSRLALP